MPTLLNIGAFSFDSAATNIPDELQAVANNKTAIEAIIKVFKTKLQRLKRGIDSVYFLDGRTGSGKSTLMITSLYKELLQSHETSILCVEPRVVLAKGNAIDICRYDDSLRLGKNVGVITGSYKAQIDSHGICYCTSAILSQIIRNCIDENSPKALTKRFKILVIDEVHTLGSPEIALLYNIHEFMEKFHDKMTGIIFVFTSATINIRELVTYYFDPSLHDSIYSDPLMIGHVKGAINYPVSEFFLNNELFNHKRFYSNLIDKCRASKSVIIHNGKRIPCRDILIFCHSTRVITYIGKIIYEIVLNNKIPVLYVKNGTTDETLNKWRSKNENRFRISILEFASSISSCANTMLSTAVEPSLEVNYNELRIIVSTPAIESGKTISTLYACVDNGLHLKPLNNPLPALTSEVTEKYNNNVTFAILPIDEFMMIQRFGRVGRECPGCFYHYYTKETLNNISKESLPEFKNMLNIVEYITPITKPLTCVDIINHNKFVEIFGVDTAIYTNYDMVNANVMTVNGLYYNISFINDAFANRSWIIVAQYLYIVCNYDLLDALMLASINRKMISSSLSINKTITSNLKLNRKNIMFTRVDAAVVDYIKEANSLYKSIKHDINIIHYGFPFHKDLKVLSFVKQ